MAEQTINAPASWFDSSSRLIRWVAPVGSRPVIISALRGSATRVFQQLALQNSGQFDLYIESSQNSFGLRADLSNAFETDGSIECTVQGRSLLVALAGFDRDESYHVSPSNVAEITAFEAYVRGLNANQRAATITLRDFVPSTAPIPTTDTFNSEFGSTEITGIEFGATAAVKADFGSTNIFDNT